MSPKNTTTLSPSKPRASRPLVDKYVHRVRFRALPLFHCEAVGQGIGDFMDRRRGRGHAESHAKPKRMDATDSEQIGYRQV